MQRGTDIHTEVEHYLQTGELRDSSYTDLGLNYRPYVESLVQHLPPAKSPELIIEHPIEIECGPGLPLWIGYIDIGYSGAKPLQIRDIKSTSDFRYAKTEQELSDNIQLISYAKWAYEVGNEGDIDLGHIYVKTEKKIVRKKPLTKFVNVRLSKKHVESVWQSELETVAQMVEAAEAPSAHDLPPTTSACNDYGGCPFREQCGITSEMSLKGLFQADNKKGQSMGNAFLEKLKAKQAQGGVSIVPPDAPARETSAQESKKIRDEAEEKKQKADEAAAKKAARAAKKAAKEAAKAAEPEEEEEEEDTAVETPKKKTNGANGKKTFTIYIDCMPKKTVGREVEPTLFEDWFSSLVMQMNEHVLEEKKLPSYLLLPYSEEKAMIQLAVESVVDKLPQEMIVTSGVPGAKDALAILSPHATTIITGIR